MKLIRLALLTVLLTYWTGSYAQVDTFKVLSPQTFMINDSTTCTSNDNIIKTANRIKVAETKVNYLSEELVKHQTLGDFTERELKQLKQDLKKAKRQAWISKWIRKPVIAVASASIGYVIGNLTTK